MKIRYQADSDLRKAIARGTIRRQPQIDFRSARPDDDPLALAAKGGRVLVSHDFQTMPARFRKFIEAQRSPGVLLIAQDLPISKAVENLLAIWDGSAPEDWENRLCLIPGLIAVGMVQPK